MAFYTYKAIDVKGVLRSDMIEADDEETAEARLVSRSLTPLSFKESGKLTSAYRRSTLGSGIRRKHLIEFAKNLSVILKTGIPFLTGLDDIGQMMDNKRLRKTITDVRDRVAGGMPFSDALEANRRVFPDIFIRLAKVGEETGRLQESMVDVATHLQKVDDLRAAVSRALIYPLFSIVTTGGAILFWFIYVMPKILNAMKDTMATIPRFTQIMLTITIFARSHWYLFILGPVAIVATVQIMKRRDATAYYWDAFKLRLPIVKQFVSNRIFALFSEQMRILLVAGITVDRALSMAGNFVGSSVLRRALLASKEKVITGARISDAFREHKVFPLLMVRMVEIGEGSGTLDDQFEFLSTHYFKRLDDVSEKLGKMLEPIIMVVVGMTFAAMIFGLLLPVYDMISKASF
jgi:type II secretory pathway component PulF